MHGGTNQNLYKYWLIIKSVLWHSPESNSIRRARKLNPWHGCRYYIVFKLLPSPRGRWVKSVPNHSWISKWVFTNSTYNGHLHSLHFILLLLDRERFLICSLGVFPLSLSAALHSAVGVIIQPPYITEWLNITYRMWQLSAGPPFTNMV